MPSRAELLFQRLQTRDALAALIGQPETADFDCKVWAGRDANQGSLAKAACGFANATGGVIIIGMVASGRGADTPDVVREFRVVADTGAVASAALDIILNLVEPGIEGVQMAVVPDAPDSKMGCVLIHVPEQETAPRRTKTDWRFYVRIASGTVPMEYFQVEDRFGRRPHPRLIVAPSEIRIRQPMGYITTAREVTLFVRNEGRGIARFPALHCYRNSNLRYSAGMYNMNQSTWPHLDRDEERFSFRGRADDVLYPGEALNIVVLEQGGRQHGDPVKDQFGRALTDIQKLFFPRARLRTQVVCEGMAALDQSFEWDEFVHDPVG